MKSLLLLALAAPMVSFAQNKPAHVRVMDKFVSYFNKQQTDSICTLFPDERTTGIKCFWAGASTDGTYNLYGKITSHEYTGTDLKELTTYKLVFSKKGEMTLRFNLTENYKFMVFLLQPYQK